PTAIQPAPPRAQTSRIRASAMSIRRFTSPSSIAEAHEAVRGGTGAIDRRERVGLGEASGRVVAAAVVAALDVPPFDRASMDGYAVIAADTAGASLTSPRLLALAGRVYTGDMPAVRVTPGSCVEIATGAPMPEGADAVIMVEETAAGGDTIAIHSSVKPRQNVGPRGADITAGQVVIEAGTVLNPGRIGSLAALGHADVEVWARPSVAILSTGNEIAAQGQPLEPGQIYDINRFTLSTLVSEHGGVPVPVSTARRSEEHTSALQSRANL